ncbi:hypothetical protein EON63_03775 [archaeon]|nr:MAG: hypothetical protein EON63_03775 [archaeon]
MFGIWWMVDGVWCIIYTLSLPLQCWGDDTNTACILCCPLSCSTNEFFLALLVHRYGNMIWCIVYDLWCMANAEDMHGCVADGNECDGCSVW